MKTYINTLQLFYSSSRFLKIQHTKHQQGSVLVIALIILLILSILAVSVMNLSTISEKLTGNQRDKSTAFQAAESALSDAESWLKNQASPAKSAASCTPSACPVYILNTLGNYQSQSASWWATYGTVYSGTLHQVQTQPQYIIEEDMFIPYDLSPQTRASGRGYYYYRITAHGTGTTNNSVSILQSVYSTQYN